MAAPRQGRDRSAQEALTNLPSKMKRKEHGAQNKIHNEVLGECSSTAQRSDSLAQAVMQCFLQPIGYGI